MDANFHKFLRFLGWFVGLALIVFGFTPAGNPLYMLCGLGVFTLLYALAIVVRAAALYIQANYGGER